MVFDKNGDFKDEVEFTDIEQKDKMDTLNALKGKFQKEPVMDKSKTEES